MSCCSGAYSSKRLTTCTAKTKTETKTKTSLRGWRGSKEWLLNPLQTQQVAVGFQPVALCGFKRLCCNAVVTKQKGRCITVDGQGTPVVTCMDAYTLMHNSKTELVGHRQCCERGLCSEARHKNPGRRAERHWCAQLADVWAYLSVAFKL